MTYRYEEIDIRDGDREEDGIASLDSTVFVSDGGYFKGIVHNHGTLIIRGGEADVIIGPNGKVIAHGGTLHAVVQLDGSLVAHEGNITIKEEGGFVQTKESCAKITYEPSIITGLTFSQYTTIHGNTQAVDCRVSSTGIVTIYKGGIFTATKKFALIRGTLVNSGTVFNSYIDFSGKVSCTDYSVFKHCVIDNGATVILTSCKEARGIIVKNGLLDVEDGVRAEYVTLERHGNLTVHQRSHVTYKDCGGNINYHGGKAIRIK